MRGQGLTETEHRGCLAWMQTGQCHGVDVRLLIVHVEPGLRNRGIGQIGLVEHLQARALPLQAQVGNDRITAGFRHPRIHHLHDDIHRLHRLRRLSAGYRHMTGIPLNPH